MRFTYDEMRAFLSAKGTDTARRESWPYDDCIRMRDGAFYRGDNVVSLSGEDEKADDWIVYRLA